MPYYYAQLDTNNKVIGVSQLSGQVNMTNMIEITEAQYEAMNLLGKTYSNGQFV